MTQLKTKIKTGDEVIVIAGKDKGKRGTVRKVKRLCNGRARVLVDAVNLVKKHTRPNPQAGKPGGIQDQENFIDISNVQIFNTMTNKADQVVFKVLKNGRKARCYQSTGEMIDVQNN